MSKTQRNSEGDTIGSKELEQGRMVEAQSSINIMTRQLSSDVNQVVAEEKHWLVDSGAFQAFISLMIVLNALQLGLEADHPEYKVSWKIAENIFTAVFLVELIVKLLALRRSFFRDYWNWFDFFLVLTSILDVWILQLLLKGGPDLQIVSVIRILRMARVGRILRMMRYAKRIIVILTGLVDAVRTTMCTGILLMVTIYVCSIFCVEWIGRAGGDVYPGYSTDGDYIDGMEFMMEFNPHLAFGSISKSMLTLFNMCLLVEWPEVVRPVLLKQPYLVIGFVLFTMLVTFGIMNIIVGIIVDNVINLSQKYERQCMERALQTKLDVLQQIHKVVFDIDTDDDGVVTVEEIEASFNQTVMQALLAKINLPRGCTPSEFYRILDQDGDGTLRREEFVQSFYRLLEGNDFQRSCLVQMGINDVKALVRDVQSNMQKQVDQHLKIMDGMMQEIRAEIRMASRSHAGPEVDHQSKGPDPGELAASAAARVLLPDAPELNSVVRCERTEANSKVAECKAVPVESKWVGSSASSSWLHAEPERINANASSSSFQPVNDAYREDKCESRLPAGASVYRAPLRQFVQDDHSEKLAQAAQLLGELLQTATIAAEKEAIKEDIRTELSKCFKDAQQLLSRLFEEDRRPQNQAFNSASPLPIQARQWSRSAESRSRSPKSVGDRSPRQQIRL